MSEKGQYHNFVNEVNAEGLGLLDVGTLLFWITLLRENGVRVTTFIRGGDGRFWLGIPGRMLCDLKEQVTQTGHEVVDAGTIEFDGDESCDVTLDSDNSADEKYYSVLILSSLLDGQVRMVCSKK